jgi:hypothetical protein
MNDREFDSLNTIFDRSEDGLLICDAQSRRTANYFNPLGGSGL